MKNLNISLDPTDPHQCYDKITNELLKVVNKQTPIKKKTAWGNGAPFMNRVQKSYT